MSLCREKGTDLPGVLVRGLDTHIRLYLGPLISYCPAGCMSDVSWDMTSYTQYTICWT